MGHHIHYRHDYILAISDSSEMRRKLLLGEIHVCFPWSLRNSNCRSSMPAGDIRVQFCLVLKVLKPVVDKRVTFRLVRRLKCGRFHLKLLKPWSSLCLRLHPHGSANRLYVPWTVKFHTFTHLHIEPGMSLDEQPASFNQSPISATREEAHTPGSMTSPNPAYIWWNCPDIS